MAVSDKRLAELSAMSATTLDPAADRIYAEDVSAGTSGGRRMVPHAFLSGARGVHHVDTVADLKALDVSWMVDGSIVRTAGYFSASDDGGAVYRYSSASAATADNGSVIAPNAGSGRYLLIHDGRVNARWWGFRLDGAPGSAAANRTALAAALTYLTSRSGGTLIIPPGTGTGYITHPQIACTGSNIHLQIDGTIGRPDNDTGWTGPNNILVFSGGSDISVDGVGVIDGNAINNNPGVTGFYGKESGIQFSGCSRVNVSGITVKRCGGFSIWFATCTDVNVNGVKVYATAGNNDPVWGKNADGIHFNQCSRVVVDGNYVESTDDCIAFTQGVAQTDTNIVVSNNVLRPHASSVTNPPSGIRFSMEPGINGHLDDVLIVGNQIDCRGAAYGILFGNNTAPVAANTRHHRRCKIVGNQIRGANGYDNIAVGPAAGSPITRNSTFAGILVGNVDDVEVDGNVARECVGRGMMVRNTNVLTMGRNLFKDITWDSANPTANAGILVDFGQGDVVDINFGCAETLNCAGGGMIQIAGGTYGNTRTAAKGAAVRNFNTQQAVNTQHTLGGFYAAWSTKVRLEDCSFEDGTAWGATIVPVSGGIYAVKNCTFNNLLIGGSVTQAGMLWCGPTGNTTNYGTYHVTDNFLGTGNYRWFVFNNFVHATIKGNSVISRDTSGTPQAEILYINFGSNTTGSPTFTVDDAEINVVQSNNEPSIWGRVFVAAGTPVYSVGNDCNVVINGTQASNPHFVDSTTVTTRQVSPSRFGNFSVLGCLKRADFNSTADQAIAIKAAARYIVRRIVVEGASLNMNTAAGGFYNGTGKPGGGILVAAAQTYVALTGSAKWQDCTLAALATTDVQTATTLYFSLTTGQGATAAADIWILGDVLQ